MIYSPFLVLNFVMPRRYREKVVQEVLEHYKQVAPKAKNRLESALSDHITIKGFRPGKTGKAPLSRLKSPVIQATESSNSVLGAILNVWLELRKDLRNNIYNFLIDRGDSVSEIQELGQGFTDHWTPEEMQGVYEEFQTHNSEFDGNDVRLMLCCLTSKAPLALIWMKWLHTLQELPADSHEWKSMPQFVKVLEQLIEKKQQEYEIPQRLQRALETLVMQADAELKYFDFYANVSGWTAEACSISEVGELIEQIEQFAKLLKRHSDVLLQGSQPTSHASEIIRRNEIEKEEKKIFQIYHRLSDKLTPPSDEPPPPSEVQSPDPKPHNRSSLKKPIASSSRGTAESRNADSETKPVSDRPTTEDNADNKVDEKETLSPAATSLVAPEELNDITLRTSQEIATQLQDEDRKELWHGLLWAFIYEDELPAAYWLAYALDKSGRVSPIPFDLLAAVQGARWLPTHTGGFVQDLLELTKIIQPTDEDIQAMIGLAAALRPSLIAPGSGMSSWLKAPSLCPSLHNLVDTLKDFSSLGIALQSEDLQGITGADEYRLNLDEASKDAQRWLQEAPRQRLKFKRASDVWHELTTSKNRLNGLVFPVAKNRIEKVEEVRKNLSQWEDRDYASNQIHAIDQQLVGRKAKSRPIQASAYQKLMRNVENVCGLIRRWCDIAGHALENERHGNSFLFDKVNAIRDTIRMSLPEWQEDLKRLTEHTQPAATAAAAACLDKAVRQLDVMLSASSEENSKIIESINGSMQERLSVETDDSLWRALKRFLVWLPEISLDDDGTPNRNGIASILPALCRLSSQGYSLHKSFQNWLDQQDYRFVDDILRFIQDDETKKIEWSKEYQERIESSQQSLQEQEGQTKEVVEQALIDDIITDEERSKYIQVCKTKSEETLNFRPAYERLHDVREDISKARARRLEELGTRWHKLTEELPSIDSELQEQISEHVQNRLRQGDVRVVEELIVLLESGKMPDGWLNHWLNAGKPAKCQVVAQQFQQERKHIEERLQTSGLWGIIRAVQQGETDKDITFTKGAISALSDWRKLKQIRPTSTSLEHQIQNLLRSLLSFLGFSFGAEGLNGKIPVMQRGNDWLYIQLAMQSRLSLVKPIPQFGSQTQGYYDLICIWERSETDTIATRLQELQLNNMRNVLIFYLGQLTSPQRRDIIRACRERELALAFLDETLVVFLAQQRDARLPIFLRCSLPYTALNPYMPFQAGDVPPEMFFGRENMINELQEPSGSCLVYGGRQLGKSALLRHVERLFHFPERDRFAWIEDMQLIFDPHDGRGTTYIWKILRDRFKKEKLINPRISTDEPKNIADYIRTALCEFPQRRVLVMFDEADAFLDADADDDFRVVLALRGLMSDTQRRFKVVFAGLHQVGRFQGLPNQPLAHFGTPVCVGPLEPPAAQQLVQQPFEALGFNFVDNGSILRILSYTNYHPGLIQRFCQILLKRLRDRSKSVEPPYQIECKDVEDVYRLPPVLKEIRERFDWTLILDKRYQIIVWTIISDQKEMDEKESNNFGVSYLHRELLERVKGFWPQGFKDTSISQMESLLVELEGLGILMQDSEQRYRLRSPNLVPLMGTVSDIEDRLLEASESERERKSTFNADNHHALLDDMQSYSPLCYAQERNLVQPRFGVGLISASDALGFQLLERSIKRFYRTENNGRVNARIPIVRRIDGKNLTKHLERHLETHSDQERLIVYVKPIGSSQENLQNIINEGLEFCRLRRRTKKRWLRVLFLFDAATSWTWLSLPSSLRKEFEDLMDIIEYPQHWTLDGIQRRLERHQKRYSDAVCEKILEVTGGWPILLDELFKICKNQDDPKTACCTIKNQLETSGTVLNGRFRQALGLEVSGTVSQVLDCICQEGPVPIEMLPDFIDNLSSEECSVATEYLLRMGCILKDSDLGDETVFAQGIIQQVVSVS